MELLDLPPELFQHIVHYVVVANGPQDAVRSRLVCKLFATTIQDEILYRQDSKYVFESMHCPPGRLQDQHGAKMIAARLLKPGPVGRYINQMVQNMIELKGADSYELREQYAHDICTSLIIERLEGVGELDVFLALVSQTTYTEVPKWYRAMPSALVAAVSTGKTKITLCIIDSLQESCDTETELGKPSWALTMVCRHCQTEVGVLLIDYFSSNVEPAQHFARNFEDWVDTAIEYGACELSLELIHRRQQLIIAGHISERPDDLPFTNQQIQALFQDGTRNTIEYLLRAGFLQPDSIGSRPALLS